MAEAITTTAPTAEALAAVIDAEDDYAAARQALAVAEAHRYAVIYQAVTDADVAAVKAMTPATVTVATIRAAVRRHAEASKWVQPTLFQS